MRKPLVVSLVLCFAGFCLGLSLMNCGGDDEDDENENYQITFSGTIEDWDSLPGTKVRAFFWYGTYVTDPLNHTLDEGAIQSDGSFEIALPEISEDLVTNKEIPDTSSDTSSITVSNPDARRSNYVELAIFDSSDKYLYMLYRTDSPQGEVVLPISFVYYVYFSDDLTLDGVNVFTEPGYYTPSGEWVEKPVISRYRYDNVYFGKGWNKYILESSSFNETSTQLEREFKIIAGELEGAKWYYFIRPDLEPTIDN